MSTDDIRTAIGDYSNVRRKIDISVYYTDCDLREKLLLPYTYNYHGRVLIIDIKNISIPYSIHLNKELTVWNEFENFLRACKDTTSFEKVKKFEWTRKVYEGS